jgi:hypothetical protein
MTENAEYLRHLAFMESLRENLSRAADVLRRCGYTFEYADPPVGKPTEGRFVVYELYEKSSHAIPHALRAFYDVIGSIEFTGRPPVSWTGCEYPDPISLAPADPTYMRAELEAWNEGCYSFSDHFCFQTAGDYIHKAGFSGGDYLIVFDDENDPQFCGEAPAIMRFTEYLRLCDEWGGFPGLRRCANHTWPLQNLRTGFGRLPM